MGLENETEQLSSPPSRDSWPESCELWRIGKKRVASAYDACSRQIGVVPGSDSSNILLFSIIFRLDCHAISPYDRREVKQQVSSGQEGSWMIWQGPAFPEREGTLQKT